MISDLYSFLPIRSPRYHTLSPPCFLIHFLNAAPKKIPSPGATARCHCQVEGMVALRVPCRRGEMARRGYHQLISTINTTWGYLWDIIDYTIYIYIILYYIILYTYYIYIYIIWYYIYILHYIVYIYCIVNIYIYINMTITMNGHIILS